MKILGIDIGGSAIKAALVSTGNGRLLHERIRVPTPQPADPENIATRLTELVKDLTWSGPIGIGFPATVVNQVVKTANNIDKRWIGTDAGKLFAAATSCPVHVLNDADAAGVAEMKFGSGKGVKGVVVVLTIGTGIGSSVFINRRLVPNSELGQLRIAGDRAETYVSDAMRKRLNLTWDEWAMRMNRFIMDIEDILRPSLIVLGGGACHKSQHFMGIIEARTEVVTASLQNEAGMIGAALAAKKFLDA